MSGTAGTSKTESALLTEFQDGQAAGSITPSDVRDIIVSTSAHACGHVNVRSFAPASMSGYIGDGTSRTVGSVYGVSTLAALAAYTLNGTTPFSWVTQSMYGFTDGMVSNMSVDSLAVQAGIVMARSGAFGGKVLTPAGKYIHNFTLLNPGVNNTNSNPPSPEIEIVGEGMLQSVHTWPNDLGSGTFAIASYDRSTGSYSRLKLSDLAIVGPGTGTTYGSSSVNMGGVGTSTNWFLQRCWISGFYYGVAIRQDHQQFIDCDIKNNYYNVYFQGPAQGQTDNWGNQFFRGCDLNGAMFASVAVAWNTMCDSANFDTTSVGYAPYGFYRESQGANTVSLPFVSNTNFAHLFVEQCGNSAIYGENANDKIVSCEFQSLIAGMSNGTAYNISSRLQKAIIYIGTLSNCNFYNGDLIGGGGSNNYGLSINAVIQAQSAIQMNFFGGAFNLVSQSTAAKPALSAPTLYGNFYDTGQSKGRFLTANATIAAGAPVSEIGFDGATTWTASSMFAGIAMAPAANGTCVPVSDTGIAAANKSTSLAISQGAAITPTTGGLVTNAGVLAGSCGFAWQGASSAASQVNIFLAPRGAVQSTPYSLPTASTSALGGVKIDGSTITINGSGVISSAAASGSPYLARIAYNPATAATGYNLPGATQNVSMNVDTTNLQVTFTAPSSGNVTVHVSVFATWTTKVMLSMRDNTANADVAGTLMAVGQTSSTNRISYDTIVTGLTGGQSYTWNLGYASTSATPTNTFTLLVGGGTTNYYGPCIIEVIAA